MLVIHNSTIDNIEQDNRGTYVSLTLPPNYRPALEMLRDKKVHITIGTMQKPRSSRMNNAGHAWCREIAEQLGNGYTSDDVYAAMKRMAVVEGYPTRYNIVDGKEEPESSALVSVEQYAILLKVIQRYADEHGLYLTEIVAGKPTKCVGGALA